MQEEGCWILLRLEWALSLLLPLMRAEGRLLPNSDHVQGSTRQRLCGYTQAHKHEYAGCGLLLARCAFILIRGESLESSRMLSLPGNLLEPAAPFLAAGRRFGLLA